MTCGRRRSTAVVASLVTLLLCPVARAHLGHLTLRAERYLKLDVQASAVRVVMSLQLEGEEALRARDHVDADDDGTMTQAEVAAALDAWRGQLRRELALSIDGRPARATWDEGVIVPLGPVRPVSTTLELVTRVPLPGAAERVRIELRDALTFAGLQSTELRLEPGDGVRFELADVAPGRNVSRRMTLAELAPNARPRTIVVVARRPRPAAPPGGWSHTTSTLVFLVIVVAAGVVTTALVVRSRRRAQPNRSPPDRAS